MTKEITIEIDISTGAMSVDTAGYAGKGCQAVIEGFAKAAGANIANIQRKREFNASPIIQNRLRQ